MPKSSTAADAVTRPRVTTTKSFPRFEGPEGLSSPSSDSGRSRPRAATSSTSSPTTSRGDLNSAIDTTEPPHGEDEDLFADREEVLSPTLKASESFEELPIEIRSLTERFLNELTAPIHPQPITVDSLSELFQEFYVKAESHIAAHIATLSLKIGREKSPAPSISSRLSNNSKNGASTPTRKASAEQQMLTASEITDRRKARRMLELKKTAWEEVVEKHVIEKVYQRIYRHRSADDEERDQKLRSRIAALSLVGIGLKELLAGADEIPEDMRQKTVEEQDHIRDLLAGARKNIQDMDNERYPLGKLQHLTAAHKSIVETLSQLFPSSSSADEILPTLIYALMTSEPATVNVVSNLKFIQRFRAASKVDGEAAYCLVNLEASTSFLETVDLSSLRASETPSGIARDPERPITPRTISAPMNLGVVPASNLVAPIDTDGIKPLPSPTTKQSRRLSNLISTSTNRINEAGDSLRGAVLDSADSAFDTINNTLDSSFKFLFGRLREHQAQSGNDSPSKDVLPKTLEDARKLVSTPPPLDEEADAASIATSTSVPENEDPLAAQKPIATERVAELFGGRRQMRDRSADSHRSGGSGSGKRVAFESLTPANAAVTSTSTAIGTTAAPAQIGNAAFEGMRNLGNTINPLNQLSRMGGLFGRSGSTGTPPPPATPPVASDSSATTEKSLDSSNELRKSSSRSESDPKPATIAALEDLKKMQPPNRRFVQCKDVRELKLGEIEDLLKDYQRLVQALGKVVASI